MLDQLPRRQPTRPRGDSIDRRLEAPHARGRRIAPSPLAKFPFWTPTVRTLARNRIPIAMDLGRVARKLCFRFSSFTAFGLLALLLCVQTARAQSARAASKSAQPASHVDASVPDSWLARVSDNIRRDEYRFSPLGAERWSAPNRAQELRSRVDRDGLEVFAREIGASGAGAPWKLRIGTAAFGRAGDVWPVENRAVSVDGERAELDHGDLTEWFVNDERGIEHGWTIARRPPGIEPLVIELAIEGDLSLRLDEGGRSGVFVDAAGEPRARYTKLVAWDASGAKLRAWMRPGPAGVEVRVDDSGAVYPITVDPLMTSAAWIVISDNWFGYSVSSAGDVNGDGYADVIVGQPISNCAYVYHGSAQGLSTSATSLIPIPGFTLFGNSVATAGDVNGDGYSDVIVGAPFYSDGENSEGRAVVYHGSAAGLDTTEAWSVESNQANAYFGVSVSTAGDVNGDGYSDVIVGAWPYDNGETDEGRAVVYYGSAAGLGGTEAWSAESNQADAWLGYSVSTAGDVNGDGYSDVIVGASGYDNAAFERRAHLYNSPTEGRAYVYHGSASGLGATAAWIAESDSIDGSFGWSVSTAGDVNGDGYSDVIVGATSYSNGETYEGRAYVYHGSSSGLAATEAWTAESNQARAALGWFVSTAGDVNGDGYSDVIIGAPYYDNDEADEGRAIVYHGSATGLKATESWTAESNYAGAQFGYAVATAGDINGDGYSDVIVGVPFYLSEEFSDSRAYVYHGGAVGLSATDGWSAESNQADALFGTSVSTAGDVNGDGYSDVIVGARFYDNGEVDEGRAFVYHGSATGLEAIEAWTAESNQANALFGSSVATAGDVNGDGYSDVIVGAIWYHNDEFNEGRAYVYHGSAAGLGTTASWTAESNQVDAGFGSHASTAGDVNGDGYSDVIVGAWLYDNGEVDEGRASVYHGSATGLRATEAWIAESNQVGAGFGIVSTAGDVNGDGYSDVIVGAFFYTNGEPAEGRAYVYHGSAAGLGTTESWTAESNQANAYFGASVSSAGDVNGDGYSDVIVGATAYDNGESNEGRAYVYHGSATGLNATEAWTAESNQVGAAFGIVSSAGDVNGDGYSDVIVAAWLYDDGESDEGRAYVYQGSATGLNASEAWTAESDQVSAELGSVSAAGDVNGDGYSDVIVGAYLYDNSGQDEGRAYVYYGNDGDGGLVRSLQQRSGTNTRPISILGSTTSSGLFHLRATFPQHVAAQAWPAPDRRAWLEWEVKPLGVAFDGKGIQRGAARTLLPTAGDVTFDEPVQLGLRAKKLRFTPEAFYHWCARVATNNPLFAHTAWFSAPGNHITESKLRNPTALR